MVFDAVYTPRRTTLLEDAEAAGALIVSGVEMFLRQAIGQFNLFTGSKGNAFTYCIIHSHLLSNELRIELLSIKCTTTNLYFMFAAPEEFMRDIVMSKF